MTWNDCGTSEGKEKELFDWLHTLELGHYFDKFVDHGYDDLEICMEIGEVDLHAIGVSDIHERLALLQAVRQLRQQQQQQLSEKDKCQTNPKKRAKDISSLSSSVQPTVHAISPLVDDTPTVSSPSILMPPVTSSLYSSWNTSNTNPSFRSGPNQRPSQDQGGNKPKGKNPFTLGGSKGNKSNKNNKNDTKGLDVILADEQNLSDFSNYHKRLTKSKSGGRQYLGGSVSGMLDSFPVETTFHENVINGFLQQQQQQQQQQQRYRTVVDHQNYVDMNDDDGNTNSEPIYESVSPVHYPVNNKPTNCRSTPITPKHNSALLSDRYEKSHSASRRRTNNKEEDEESLSSGCYAAPASLTAAGLAVVALTGNGQPANLTRLKTQLRDQVMQDGINMSRIQDESILRNMAAQYAAELASTLTLTPSSTSACSSSSDSSVGCSSSAGSSSVQTPADVHYQQVFQQLRELWLEERMKLFPMPASFLHDDCGCERRDAGGRNHLTMTPRRLKSSCSSTPTATTPNGCCPCDGITMMGNSGAGGVDRSHNGSVGGHPFPNARSVPCLLHPSCHNNSPPSGNNLINSSNSPCKSPERQTTQQHQYLQHVIISNSSSFSHPTQQSSATGNGNINGNINAPKQTYTPGIYQPSSCLLDKDEIYDYAPPVRYSPQRTVNNNRSGSVNGSSSSNSSPTKRCFTQAKGPEKVGRSANGISTVRGASRSSYTLATTVNNGNPGNYDTMGASRSGNGAKSGCRTLANLSKLSRRLGLSRFFRTLKIHGNQTDGGGERNGGERLNANSHNICRCYQSNLNSELTSLCQCQYGLGGFSRNTLPDLAAEANRENANSKCSMSSLPSNERIIQTINRLKLEELQKRKERIAQEHQMVRDTLFYMQSRNS